MNLTSDGSGNTLDLMLAVFLSLIVARHDGDVV